MVNILQKLKFIYLKDPQDMFTIFKCVEPPTW